ncbi:MAG: BMP family ABC transporter substrate-binding protein [Lachnospiraceae bacterium]|nr:BMP family ABC transporter substrate-binding protein [Lachnospiraceae bacterium]
MAQVDYNKAARLGEKEYHICVASGQYPYLPVLDELLSHVEVEAQVSLGLVEIPMNQIVGTYSAGRTTAFARNFMPILDSSSEFATKWSQLYDALAEEGLRDPIKAYEFNNKFYVMEGNKRVSVLKFMDAVSIEGTVTRVIPKRTDDPECRIYYEFLEFYEATQVNYLWMTKEGGFRKLLELTDTEPGEKWTEEKAQDFNMLYTFFAAEFEAKAQNKITITAGDALCVYLEIYGYEKAKEKGQADFKKDLSKIWNEILMYNNPESVAMVLHPTEESQRTALTKLFPVGTPPLKVAFIHDSSVQNSGWTYAHELGRKYIQDVFGEKIIASCIERVDGDSADDVFEAAIEAGNKVIFATSPKLCAPSLRAALDHPEIKILNCSMNNNHKTVRSYYLRLYEAKFINGAIAGSLISEGNIGYLADYPISGTTAEINAFALGVQMTNPRARVCLEWSSVKDRDWREEFRKKEVELVSGRDLNATVSENREFGLFRFLENGEHQNLAMAVRHWGKLYEELLRSVMRGGYKNDDAISGTQALNYYWGMSADAVDVIYSRNLSAGGIRLLRTLREGIRSMEINPFTGPIYSQDGCCRCEDGQTLDMKDIVNIDWLAENIDGYMPELTELKEEAIELVKLQGVKQNNENTGNSR